jgi:hypothetical protein
VLYAILAALVSAACVSAPFVRAARLASYERPSESDVLARIAGAQSGDRTVDWLWELDELTIQVDGATRAPAELARALGRASLASGTAFAVLTLASHPDLAHLPEAGVSFGVGVVGAGAASYFGRLAKQYSERARNHWSLLARSVRRSIEATGKSGPAAPPGQ